MGLPSQRLLQLQTPRVRGCRGLGRERAELHTVNLTLPVGVVHTAPASAQAGIEVAAVSALAHLGLQLGLHSLRRALNVQSPLCQDPSGLSGWLGLRRGGQPFETGPLHSQGQRGVGLFVTALPLGFEQACSSGPQGAEALERWSPRRKGLQPRQTFGGVLYRHAPSAQAAERGQAALRVGLQAGQCERCMALHGPQSRLQFELPFKQSLRSLQAQGVDVPCLIRPLA